MVWLKQIACLELIKYSESDSTWQLGIPIFRVLREDKTPAVHTYNPPPDGTKQLLNQGTEESVCGGREPLQALKALMGV